VSVTTTVDITIALESRFLKAKEQDDQTAAGYDSTQIAYPAPAKATRYVFTNEWTVDG
jgi:hypothetical protein